jgi:hypothetical protein
MNNFDESAFRVTIREINLHKLISIRDTLEDKLKVTHNPLIADLISKKISTIERELERRGLAQKT